MVLLKMKKIRVLLILTLFILFSSSAAESQPLKIHFLDVGEGDSILIEAPSGKTVLIDSGNLITGLDVVRYLEKNNIYELDHLILTHPHLDHIGGVFSILQMLDIENIYDNGEDLSKERGLEDVYSWYSDLVRNSSKYSILGAGDSLVMDEVKLKILWPNKPFISSNFNVNSLVIMVEYRAFSCLLAGDLKTPAEVELLKKKSHLEADILKVGHHGCDDASSRGFLEAIKPKISIISVNENNIRGYPSQEVLTRLEEIGTKIYRTDKDGNIVVQVEDDGKVTVKVTE